MPSEFHSALKACLLLFILMAVSSVGCSSDSRVSKVSGFVKAKGKLLTEGKVMFYPIEGGRPAIGNIGADGRYVLTTYNKGDGAVPGIHKVTIRASKTIQKKNQQPQGQPVDEISPGVAEGEEDIFDFENERIVWLIASKYSNREKSTLTATVEKGQENEINFDSADFK